MDFKLAPAKAVLGAPFEGEYHLVWDATVTLPMKPCGNDPNLWIEVRLPNGNSKGWATGTVPAALPIRAPVTIEKGQPVGYSIGYSNIVETTCAPGLYGVRLRYRVNTGWNNYDAFWKGEAVSNWANIEITAPEGEDAAIWTRFRAQVPEGACWDFHRWAVYHGAEILVSFPASTYAGYALAQSGPGGSLSWSEKWWKLTAQQRDDAWYVPQAASKAAQDARRKSVREGYEGFVQRARAFLAIHPDFAQAGILRKELANALFMLDRRDEALEQLELLAKMTGPVAEEAQKALQACGEAAPQPPQAGSK